MVCGLVIVKTVLFDFDGVVVDSEPLHYRTFMEILGPLGISVDLQRWYRDFAGTGSRRIIEVLIREYELKEDIGILVQKRKTLYEQLVRKGELRETDGIREFLGLLEKKGIKKAIVSGSHRTNVDAALEVLHLTGFDLIVSGDEMKKMKPDPDPFLLAAQRLGVPPASCIVFEDSVAGSIAAKRAGMKLVVVESPALPNIKEYDLLIRDFRKDLEKIIPLLL